MKKKLVTMALAGALTVSSAFTALAGWEQTGTTWKYQTIDGNYYNDGWHWIDGNGDNIAECYFFNIDSTMLSNTTTPDNFTVNTDGAWTVNGIVQTKVLNGSTSSTGQTNNTPNNQSQPQTGNSQSSGGYGNASEYADCIPGYTGPSIDEIKEDPNTTEAGGGGGSGTFN